MLTIHSPKFSIARSQITKNSPTFRHKRVPSAQDNYTVESNPPKVAGESPAKLSEGRKRKSHLETHPGPKANSKDKGTKQIIDSIQNLKEEYKALKEAYRELIDERIKNTHEIAKVKTQNSKLLQENQRLTRQNERNKMQMSFLQQENQRTRREFFKLLQVEKFKAQKLEQSLVQKEQYINQTLLKIRTEGDDSTLSYPQNTTIFPKFMPHEDVSLTISQDKSALINDASINNQSQFLSFSLSSVLEESTDKELSMSKRKHQHVKAASDLPLNLNQEEKRARDLPSFRKTKKDIPKLELNNNMQSKANLTTHAQTKVNGDKKPSRAKMTKSFRDKENRQTLNNQKKKSKKLINLSAVTEI